MELSGVLERTFRRSAHTVPLSWRRIEYTGSCEGRDACEDRDACEGCKACAETT